MPERPRVVIVMPAYNAARTLERTYADIPHDLVHHMILVDDVSKDETVEIAERLGLEVITHRQNLGYGGNQKTCYDRALEWGADVVVMLHPDYQYDATRIPQLVAPILSGDADLMLGSRFLGDPLAGGMPRWKFVSNRFLTGVENAAFGLHLSEYHTGLRAYSRRLLETIPYRLNSDDFVFDQELIAQVVAVGGMRIGEIAVPTRYFEEASSVNFKRSVVYGLSTLRVVARFLLHRTGVRRSAKLSPRARRARARRRVAMRLPRGTGRAVLGIAISVVALALVFRTVDVPAAMDVLRTAQPQWIALLVAFVIGDILLRAVRWRVLLSPVAAVPFGTMLASLLVGYLANNILPARLGEVVRSHDLGTRTGLSRPTILGTIVVERVVDTVVVVAIASIAILVLSVRGIVASAVLVGLARDRAARPRDRPGDRRPPAAGCGAGRGVHRALAARPARARPAARRALDREGRPDDGRRGRPLGRVVVVHGARVRGRGPGGGRRADDRARRRSSRRARTWRRRSRPGRATWARSSWRR